MQESWLTAAANSGVGTAIRQAALSTGTDFSYLLRQARIESGFNPNAKARTSSATGLFQFTEQTWLATVKKHGVQQGLDWAAAAIQKGSNGRYHVADPNLRQAILNLRKDPQSAASMAGEFASDNRAYLEQHLGRPVETVDLYLAHFLGAGGASKFLSAQDADPSTAAASVVPAAARANRSIFYKSDGTPRTLAEVRDRFAAKLGVDAGSMPPSQTPTNWALRLASADGSTPQPTTPSAHYARLAYLMLAELGD
ncbi:MAG TPA: transglycosylase SLT domain-containing protein [Allosphingosinicella sp.]|nr:transglycosylase SLT domain-containing protein [Allosphingosinicella sp.]